MDLSRLYQPENKRIGGLEMNKKYLLTYKDKMHVDYGWFETEEELKEFAEGLEDRGYEINEAFEIKEAREIEL